MAEDAPNHFRVFDERDQLQPIAAPREYVYFDVPVMRKVTCGYQKCCTPHDD